MTATIQNNNRQPVSLPDPDGGGRPPVIPTPEIQPSAEWRDAWMTYELELMMLGRSKHTVYQRQSQVLIMARHATVAGLGPAEITKQWMQKYLLAQKADRQGNGFGTLYEGLRQFWLHYAKEYEAACPMTGIPRPKLVETPPVPVLEPHQIKAILAACSGTRYDRVWDRAIVTLLFQTGLRRAELSALDWSDVDMTEGTLSVRHGKGDKARTPALPTEAHRELLRLLRAARRRGKAEPGDPVFLSVHARPRRLTPAGVSSVITAIGTRAGIPTLHPHQFRHSWTDAARLPSWPAGPGSISGIRGPATTSANWR